MIAGAAQAERADTQNAAPAESLKLLVVTDAWPPQVNGVVRTLQALAQELKGLGHTVRFATPESHVTVPMPAYPEIRLALFPRPSLIRLFSAFRPDAVHIATEGPLGFAARAICQARLLPFTSSFHTRFPDYLSARIPFVPERALYRALKNFHAAADVTMVSTPSLRAELEAHGFRNLRLWTRGVDTEQFQPGPKDAFEHLGLSLTRPVFLSVGRVAIEKNLEAFLRLDLPGSQVVVGDGPQRRQLQARYRRVHFLGARTGVELARIYAASDVFVFPSRTDTFGLVLLEALASGLPVAAYPVVGPLDVIGNAPVGALRTNLRTACLEALMLAPKACRAFAVERSWQISARQFLANLVLCRGAFG
jgi:1,2-diacylglycerol 3-alpha-glucosyltransferase/glucuronosyltransferase